MNISHIEHVGIAVPSLDEAIPFYENILGLKCFAIEEVADQKVRTAFFKVGGAYFLIGHFFDCEALQAKHVFIEGNCLVEAGYGYADVFDVRNIHCSDL